MLPLLVAHTQQVIIDYVMKVAAATLNTGAIFMSSMRQEERER